MLDFIVSIVILIFSVIIHEISHGFTANALGDPTARLSGRLSINPIKHIDFIGSIVVPAFFLIIGGFILGWAKPVPINSYNFKNRRIGEAVVSFAGPLSNILLAVLFGILIRVAPVIGLSDSFVSISATIVFMNCILAVFNLVPVPPLDGSKILFAVLPNRYWQIREILEKNQLIIVFFFIFFAWQFISPISVFLFKIITGISFG